jgi:hypothetical protein
MNAIEFLKPYWKTAISKMETEEIERRSLLVSLSEKTSKNLLFKRLLTEEYNRRKTSDE